MFKQRISREGRGKSGGYRAIIFLRAESHCFFAYGFSKSDKANVSVKELQALKRLAHVLLSFSREELDVARASGDLIEVAGDDEG